MNQVLYFLSMATRRRRKIWRKADAKVVVFCYQANIARFQALAIYVGRYR